VVGCCGGLLWWVVGVGCWGHGGGRRGEERRGEERRGDGRVDESSQCSRTTRHRRSPTHICNNEKMKLHADPQHAQLLILIL
jgi:hypothetical protein